MLPSQCSKVTYDTLIDALRARSEMYAKGRRNLRVYRCRKCRRFHLTRLPPKWRGKQWHVGCA